MAQTQKANTKNLTVEKIINLATSVLAAACKQYPYLRKLYEDEQTSARRLIYKMGLWRQYIWILEDTCIIKKDGSLGLKIGEDAPGDPYILSVIETCNKFLFSLAATGLKADELIGLQSSLRKKIQKVQVRAIKPRYDLFLRQVIDDYFTALNKADR